MTADRIAEVVADIRAGRIQTPNTVKVSVRDMFLPEAQLSQPVVDCTAIFEMQRQMTTIDMYGDYPSIVPPWEDALLCYTNTFGNVIVMQVHREDWDGSPLDQDAWTTGNPVEWDRVRWISTASIWIGGVSGDSKAMPTTGPCHILRHAIRDDGAPEDINWIALMARPGQFCEVRQMDDPGAAIWQAATVTLTASLNFLGCSNVDVAEPARPRPMRRRIARTGVQVQTIVVRPPGKRRLGSGGARPIDASENVLSPVRGHFARYGIDGRGLLFGKHAGKFWIPGHVRGAGSDNAEPRDYVLKPRKPADTLTSTNNGR